MGAVESNQHQTQPSRSNSLNTQALLCDKTTEPSNVGVGRHLSPCSPARSRTSGPPRPPRSRSYSSRIESADLRVQGREPGGGRGPARDAGVGGKGTACGRTEDAGRE